MARQRGFQHQTRSRRMVSWGIGPREQGGEISASGSLLWDTGVSLAVETRATVVRTRGIVSVGLVGPGGTDGDSLSGAHGIGIITNDAFAASAFPTPLDDVDWPGWLWHQFFDIAHGDVTAGSNDLTYQRNEIDSKAMRKLGDNEIVIGVSEFVEFGALTWEIRADCRLLVKLS